MVTDSTRQRSLRPITSSSTSIAADKSHQPREKQTADVYVVVHVCSPVARIIRQTHHTLRTQMQGRPAPRLTRLDPHQLADGRRRRPARARGVAQAAGPSLRQSIRRAPDCLAKPARTSDGGQANSKKTGYLSQASSSSCLHPALGADLHFYRPHGLRHQSSCCIATTTSANLTPSSLLETLVDMHHEQYNLITIIRS